MNLFHLRYFVQLAHTQHYTRAAEQLCITQPSLSHAIAQLETELGVPLFEKTGRNTTLTHFGEEFLICAENTLSTLDAGVETMQRIARGEGLIRLGLLRTLGINYVPRLAAAYLAAHPDKEIRFTFNTGVSGELISALQARRFDLVFCSRPALDLGLTAIPVEKQDLVMITPRNHPLASLHAVDLRDTLQYPYVRFARTSGLRGVIDGIFAQIGAEPQIAIETEEDQVIAGLVAQGFGIAIVPYMDLLLQLDVRIIQISYPSWERTFYMVSDDTAFHSPAVKDFRQFVLNGGAM